MLVMWKSGRRDGTQLSVFFYLDVSKTQSLFFKACQSMTDYLAEHGVHWLLSVGVVKFRDEAHHANSHTCLL